ncbi:MAG: SUMF1/EgtB/PvdO family nonheme iron enzyme [Alphaproteobacteria bacterium]|nr:SUMF1/EgtB/PvdO family nonheme iron enzyme [Alphaproteobacteria bacterium]
MPGKIFVNYRRDDSAPYALNVAQYLERAFGSRNVFIDIDRLRAGEKFAQVLEQRLGQCDVMVAIIGPDWLEIRNEDGTRRLEDTEDWVRLEIERALARGVVVIPVTVGGGALPSKAQLPEVLQPLVDHHAANISRDGFRHEMAGLVQDIKSVRKGKKGGFSAGRIAAGLVLLGLIAGGGYVGYQGWRETAPSPSAAAPHPSPLPPSGEREQALAVKPGSGESFRDCPTCPEMVVVPAGSFTMGSPKSEKGRYKDEEGPEHEVKISQPFAAGKFEVTWEEWDACVADGGCDNGLVKEAGGDNGWGKGHRPVINVNWNDAKAYTVWLSKKTGKPYRLLTEAEWEYAARAGTTTPFWWGGTISKSLAQYSQGSWGSAGQTVPVGSFKPNAWGLFDMHGNVWEWTEDCWNDSYTGAPADGATRTDGDCRRRVIRGGAWANVPNYLRSASRLGGDSPFRVDNTGFRVARSLTR